MKDFPKGMQTALSTFLANASAACGTEVRAAPTLDTSLEV